MLDSLGFSSSADVIYKHLVTRPPAAVDELATDCNLDPSAVASDVERLVDRGVVRQVDDHPRRYAAVSPDFAVESLVQAREQELRSVRVAVARLTTVFRSAQTDDQTGLVEMVNGSGNVRHAVDQLQMIATSEIRGLTRPPYVNDPVAPNDVELVKLAAGSVRYRGVWDRSALDLPGVFDAIQRDIRKGEETRIFDGVPIKLFIADDRLAIIPLSRVELETCDALIVHPSELLTSLSALFELIWRSASPVRRRPDDVVIAGSGIDPDQYDLLQMLGSGMTDESIARSLGTSVRTVQRHVRQLMDALGVNTRLQAGVAAARRGWL